MIGNYRYKIADKDMLNVPSMRYVRVSYILLRVLLHIMTHTIALPTTQEHTYEDYGIDHLTQ